MVEMTVIFQELHKQIKIINIRLVFWVEDFAWSAWSARLATERTVI